MPAAPTPSHLETFAAARWPDRRRVVGRWLEPLAVGHLLILTRLGNPLVGGTQPLDPVAIGTVVALCSLPAPRAIGHVGGWLFRWRVVYLSGLAWFSRRALLRITTYLVEGTRRPKLISSGQGEPSAVPFWLTVLSTLMREYRMSEEEAMAYPAAAAVWLCIPAWESSGGIRLVSEIELEAAAELKAQEVH